MRRLLLSTPAFGLYAVVLLSLAILLAGNLIPIGEPRIFDPLVNQLIAIGVLLLIWAIFVAIWAWRRRRRNEKLIEDLAPEPDPTGEAIDAETQRLRSKFSEALGELRKLRFRSRLGGSRYLYELPWYIFIGPPGAGKTTALMNCGLEFPLKRGHDIAVSGVSGTRDCDWMFTDDAVFIDTAGRYVTQDSDSRVDRAAWNAFLDLLVRNRPAEPLNGVIVAISVEDIATAEPAELDAHAAAIRRGLLEIGEKMRARVPVYVMFTKSDLLIGFDEFFQSLPKREREQVWGVTLPFAQGDEPRAALEQNLGRLEEEFDQLVERLGEKQFPRMQEEQDLGIRSRIFGFPAQFSSLSPVVTKFLRDTFSPDRYSEPILLRGVYFTSATQVGQPVDRLIASMSREFGLDRQATGVMAPRSERAYFLRDLLQKVIFPESGLVNLQRRRSTILSLGRYATLAACLAVPLILGLGWWNVHAFMREQTAPLIATIADYEFSLEMLGPDATQVEDGDIAQVTQMLDQLRAERERLAEASPPFGGLGVDDIEGLRAQADAAYMKALDDLFRPRLLYQLQGWMDRHNDDPAELYKALKAYLIVGGRAPELGAAEIGFASSVLEDEWLANNRYDPVVQQDLATRFQAHLVAMFEGMERGAIRERALNEGQIARARANAKVTPAQRAYGILMEHQDVKDLPEWSIPDAVGPAAEQVLVRASGKDLGAPIDGIYTFEGFWTVFSPNANRVVEQALEERWVLNREAEGEVTDADKVKAGREIRRIYHEDYIAAWSGLLNDIRIIPFQDAAHAAEVLRTLAAPGSPLRDLLQEIVRETALSDRPGDDAEIWSKVRPIRLGGRVGSMISRINSQTSGMAGDMAGDMAGNAASPPPAAAGQGEPTSEAFADLRQFVGSADEGSPLEAMLQRLRALRTVVSDMAARRTGDLSELTNAAAARELAREVEVAPEPIRRMIDEMLSAFNTAVADGLHAELNDIWRNSVAALCARRLAGRYPFGSGDEVPLGDLAEVLGPDGEIDKFFKEHLASMVDTNQVDWRWKGLGLSLGIPNNRLEFFQTAAEIRDAFFPSGGQRPDVRFGTFPVAMDPEVLATRLVIGGTDAEFEQGEGGAAQFSWPGPAPENGAEAELIIKTGATDISGASMPPTTETIRELGPWGLFRLIDKSELRTLGSGAVVHVGIRALDRRVVLGFRMESAENPFALHRKIRAFRCPSEL